jgi:hypothetical protein
MLDVKNDAQPTFVIRASEYSIWGGAKKKGPSHATHCA